MKEKNKGFDSKKLLLVLAAVFIPVIGPILVLRSDKFTKVGKTISGAWLGIFLIGLVFGGAEEENGNSANTAVETKKVEETKNKVNREFRADLFANVKDNKVILKIKSNVPDGGIFELSLLDNDYNMKSDTTVIKDGVAEKTFIMPEDAPVGTYLGMASFSFNSEDYNQPENIINTYGKDGSKMLGDQKAQKTDGKSYFGQINDIDFYYPTESAVKQKQNQTFENAVNELIDKSNGVIVDVSPRHGDGSWKFVNVFISDDWYYSPEHEKERLAEQLGSTIQNIIWNTEKVDETESIMVYLVDTYGKDLATPKILGGYKIKR